MPRLIPEVLYSYSCEDFKEEDLDEFDPSFLNILDKDFLERKKRKTKMTGIQWILKKT